MSHIAIIGAGPLGGALAHKLAARNRVAEIRLIDAEEAIARGKALDILQSAPIESWHSRVVGEGSVRAAAGARTVVLADATSGAEHAGEAALALVRQLESIGVGSPLVFAGASQRELMMRCARELRIAAPRLIGSAPMALGSALRAVAAAVLDTSPVEIQINVFGVPPRHAVIAWEEATVSGQPLTAALGANRTAALSARLSSLWPPGPYALAAAAARVVEAVCAGSRRRHTCFIDAGRGRIAALPVELGGGGISRVLEPALTPLERTALETSFEI